MEGRSCFRELIKHRAMKKLFLAIKHNNLQGKKFFRSNYFGSEPFLMSCYFIKIFVHPLVIAVICFFSVYKSIGGTQQKFTWSKSTVETLEKGVKFLQS